jgi:hypothetical protein
MMKKVKEVTIRVKVTTRVKVHQWGEEVIEEALEDLEEPTEEVLGETEGGEREGEAGVEQGFVLVGRIELRRVEKDLKKNN